MGAVVSESTSSLRQQGTSERDGALTNSRPRHSRPVGTHARSSACIAASSATYLGRAGLLIQGCELFPQARRGSFPSRFGHYFVNS